MRKMEKGKCHSSAIRKAFQIGTNNFSFHRHFNKGKQTFRMVVHFPSLAQSLKRNKLSLVT